MTLMITGGAGYIGSHMILRLLELGVPVVVIDNLSTGRRELVPEGAMFEREDIGDKEKLASLLKRHRIEAVVHFAGSIVVPDSVTDPLGYYFNNTVKSRNLIEACMEAGVDRFLFSSTAAVYGNPEHVPIPEDAPLKPLNPYGRSKLMTEWMLEDTGRAHGTRYVALRYFNVSGADPAGRSGQVSPKDTHLIKVASEVATGKREHLPIYGTDYPTPDGTCVRDYIHVTDLVEAHIAALSYLERGGPSAIFNCGYGRGASVLEVIRAFNRMLGRELPVVRMDRRPGDASILVADARRIGDVLGWRPRHDDLDFIVRTAFEWERKLRRNDGLDAT